MTASGAHSASDSSDAIPLEGSASDRLAADEMPAERSPSVIIPLDAIRSAAARIARVAHRTPLEPSVALGDRAGVEMYVKLECFQRTRSFKLRGAYNATASLDEAARVRGLVAASAGNHGLGVAFAARETGSRVTIFVPADAPETKRARIAAYGAELTLVDGDYDETERRAAEWAERTGATFVHAYDDPAVVAGQGTVGLEILDQLPIVKTVIVPVGGGGLIAGVGAALRGSGSAARIVGVQSVETSAMHAAFAAGAPVSLAYGPTLADGLSGAVSEISYLRARAICDEIVLVSEQEIREAIRFLFRSEGVVAEGSGVVGIAAILGGRVSADGPTAVIVSGGNIDAAKLGRILVGS